MIKHGFCSISKSDNMSRKYKKIYKYFISGVIMGIVPKNEDKGLTFFTLAMSS
jgi:hypothetical protein